LFDIVLLCFGVVSESASKTQVHQETSLECVSLAHNAANDKLNVIITQMFALNLVTHGVAFGNGWI
jgi:hypothetical protein